MQRGLHLGQLREQLLGQGLGLRRQAGPRQQPPDLGVVAVVMGGGDGRAYARALARGRRVPVDVRGLLRVVPVGVPLDRASGMRMRGVVLVAARLSMRRPKRPAAQA